LFTMLNFATGWDLSPDQYMEIGKRIQTLRQMFGIKHGIKTLDFSPDERFLAAVGFDNVFVIWDTQDFSVIFNRIYENSVDLCQWSEMKEGKHNSYSLVTAINQKVFVNYLVFDVASM